MTREEEIYKAAENNTEIECCSVAEDDFEVCDITDSFIAGAKWADDHPKSPWISVNDDLPYKHEKLTHSNYTDRVLVLSRHGFSEVAFMSKIGDAWEWNTFIVVLYWMPIPNFPKE